MRLKSMLLPYAPKTMHLGPHRTAETGETGLFLKYHDLPIVCLSKDRKRVTLDLCGRWANGTTKAMNSFLQGAGIDVTPSLSKGIFTAKYQGRTYKASWDNKITIEL